MPRITLNGFECSRCGHTWIPRLERVPEICPKCKSPYWDRPIERPTTSEAKKKSSNG